MRVQIVGAGNMGTALAVHLAGKGHSVFLYTVEHDVALMLKKGENRKYLPGIKIPQSVKVVEKLQEVPVSVICVPTKVLLEVSKKVKGKLITPCKGLINDRPISTQIKNMTMLQGPCDAQEIAEGKETIGVAAGKNALLARRIFQSKKFRIMIEKDVIGAQLGGAFKNAVAIIAGTAPSENLRGPMVTEGFGEIIKLGTRMGAKEETFHGPAGLGDLLTTCYGGTSRNRAFGELLARGCCAKTALKKIGQTVEGIETAKAMRRLAKKYRIKLPLVGKLCRLL